MKTERLFDLDSFVSQFSATVLSCEKGEGGFAVVLDKTVFFPESGGQQSDVGNINGIPVTYVFEKDDTIIHICENELFPGETVNGQIDFSRRFGLMQNHSGEHIVSGIVNRNFGLNNVGFHLTTSGGTIDFDGELSTSDLLFVENLANKVVFENKNITCYYPEKTELQKLNYRSKREISGPVRIVEIQDTDLCACCAPHVKKTGQIGIIKLLGSERMRGGIRVNFKCGQPALEDYRNRFNITHSLSDVLSVPSLQVEDGVKALLKKCENANQTVTALKKKMAEMVITSSKEEQTLFLFEDYQLPELQKLADGISKKWGKPKIVLSKSQNGYLFSLCGANDNLFLCFKEKFNVRGGGRNGMYSGTVLADIKEIENFFK